MSLLMRKKTTLKDYMTQSKNFLTLNQKPSILEANQSYYQKLPRIVQYWDLVQEKKQKVTLDTVKGD